MKKEVQVGKEEFERGYGGRREGGGGGCSCESLMPARLPLKGLNDHLQSLGSR